MKKYYRVEVTDLLRPNRAVEVFEFYSLKKAAKFAQAVEAAKGCLTHRIILMRTLKECGVKKA